MLSLRIDNWEDFSLSYDIINVMLKVTSNNDENLKIFKKHSYGGNCVSGILFGS